MQDLETKLNTKKILLFRDTDHVAKSMRNAILKNEISWNDGSDSPVKISINDLTKAAESSTEIPPNISAEISFILKFHSPGVSSFDKLRLDPVKRISNNKLISFLKSAHIKELQAIGRYFKLINVILYLWEYKDKEEVCLNESIDERINYIKREIIQLNVHSRSQFKEQINSIISNYQKLKIKEITDGPFIYTVLVSRMVENYFSILKNKVSNPSVDEYFRISTKTTICFVKENCTDLKYFPTLKKETTIGSYNKTSGSNMKWKTFILLY